MWRHQPAGDFVNAELALWQLLDTHCVDISQQTWLSCTATVSMHPFSLWRRLVSSVSPVIMAHICYLHPRLTVSDTAHMLCCTGTSCGVLRVEISAYTCVTHGSRHCMMMHANCRKGPARGGLSLHRMARYTGVQTSPALFVDFGHWQIAFDDECDPVICKGRHAVWLSA